MGNTIRQYAAALRLAWPLALGMANNAVMQFVDRVFLAHESVASLEAVLRAAVFAGTFLCLAQAVVGYSGTFVAQYHGAGDAAGERRSYFAGLLLAGFSALALLALIPLGCAALNAFSMSSAVAAREKTYYSIVMLGGFSLCGTMAASGYFSALGRTRLVFAVNLVGNALNVLLDWLLIFGCGPVPAMGIAGAAWATVAAQTFQMVALNAWVFCSWRAAARRPADDNAAAVRPERGEGLWTTFGKVLKYGLPSGLYSFLNLLSFTVFVSFTGTVGDLELAVSNAAFTVNYLLFAPIEGFSVAAGILVGRSMGADDPAGAARAGTRMLVLAEVYIVVMSALILLFSRPILDLFLAKGAAAGFDPAAFHALGLKLFLIMAAWQCFDTADMVWSGALKGAGDTRFVMKWMLVCAFGFWLPLVFVTYTLSPTMPELWSTMVAYVVLICIGTWWRWRFGSWRRIRLLA